MFFSPLVPKLAAAMGRSQSLAGLGERLSPTRPSVEIECRPAIYDPADLSRVTGLAPYRTLPLEISRIEGGVRRYPSSEMFRVRRMLLVGGNLYTNTVKIRIAGNTSWRPIRVPSRKHVGGFMASSMDGARYFGDWMANDIAALVYGAPFGEPFLISDDTTLMEHQAGYLHTFGSGETKILVGPCVLEDFVLEAHKGLTVEKIDAWKQTHALGSARARANPVAGVYLRRGTGGEARLLENESEVEALLATFGIVAIEPTSMSVPEITSIVAGTGLVIGVEGSQLAHGFWAMAQNGAMLVLQPPYRFNNPYKDRCDPVGIRYGFIVGHPSSGGFTVDLTQLGRLTERLMRR